MRTVLRALLLAAMLASCEAAPPSAPPAPTPPAPSATPTPPPPTPPPAGEQLERGLELRSVGEHEEAARWFHALEQEHPESPHAPAARYYLAESFAQRGLWSSAATALAPIAAGDLREPYTARAIFLLARAQAESGAHAEAADTYGRYAALATPAAGYAHRARAEQLALAGNDAEAGAAYEIAAGSEMARGARALAYERAAEARARAAQPAEALRIYAALLEFAQQPAYRARVLLAAADLAAQTDDGAQARAWRESILAEAPGSPEAVMALDALAAEGYAPPDAAAAAAIYVAAERWPEARVQLIRAADQAEGAARADLLRRAALALREGDAPDYPAAAAELDALLAETDPQSDQGRQLRLDRIQTTGQAGDPQAAIDGYRQYAADLPNDPRAAMALARAAILLERRGDMADAEAQRLDLVRRFPESPQAAELRFGAGMARYRAGAAAEAAEIWEGQAQREAGVAAAQGAFWAARARQSLGEAQAADALLAQAIALAPTSYYGVRAAEIAGLPKPGGALALAAPLTEADWAQLDAWVASWATAPDPQAPITADSVASAPPALRAVELADLLLPSESLGEWRAALGDWGDDPRRLALLTRHTTGQGATTAALEIAAQLASLAPPGAEQPLALRRLLYPAPHAERAIAAAQEQQIDPLALYALMRQESRFNPWTISVAGARGLAQIMPETGRGIAQRLGVTPFDERDLHRPLISLRFGAFYLGNQLRRSDDNLAVALAGYNGGPANADRWVESHGLADLDLFVELIDYGETRAYVKIVYANYRSYQQIYRGP